MKIHHLRSATFVIEKDDNFILIDPMLGKKGSYPPIALFRQKPRKNPMVEMPENSEEILGKVTHAIISHIHPDHIDKAGMQFLTENNIAVICSKLDEQKLKKKGIRVVQSLDYWQAQEFLKGRITAVPGLHGYGFISKPMGNVMGFAIQFSDKESIYISSDTIYTPHIDRVFSEIKPDVSVLAAGSAQFDFGGPLLMNKSDIVKFVKNSPGKVYANHMEVMNHCTINRPKLKALLAENQLTEKVMIPEDGEVIVC